MLAPEQRWCAVLLLQNLIADDDMAQILGPLHPEVKCTIIAGAIRRRLTT